MNKKDKTSVSIIASGFGLSKANIKGSISWWSKEGLSLSRPQGLTLEKDLLCASSIASRVDELKKAFSKDTDGDIVWALRGGYGMQEILPYLKKSDFKAQKTYVGFSDCTSLHYYLNKNLGQASVHACHANAAFQKFSSSKINNEIRSLIENPKVYSKTFKGLKRLNSIGKKTLTAQIVGGNLTTLCSLIGTKFDRGALGDFLFLEEVEEPAYKINRMLEHLKQSGFLEGVKAVLFGHITHSNKEQARLVLKIVKRWADAQKFPIVSGVQAGHIHHENTPLWFGKKSTLVLDDKPYLLNNI